MVHFIGAGPGAPDLITLRGMNLLQTAGCVIYAGSLVNPLLLGFVSGDVPIYDSAYLTLEQIIQVIQQTEQQNRDTARLHTGDPSLYGAIQEQIDALDQLGISWDITPGVSSFCAAAAALGTEYTIPENNQTVILTRMAGRTPVPDEQGIAQLAVHHAAMVIFLSAGMLPELVQELYRGGYTTDTPAALVYKTTWPEERIVHGTLDTLVQAGIQYQITKTALVLVGEFLHQHHSRSRLYHPDFHTGFRNI